MKNKIMIEITNFCSICNSHDCCPEDECVLYRIEKLIVKDFKKKSKDKYNNKKSKGEINGTIL